MLLVTHKKKAKLLQNWGDFGEDLFNEVFLFFLPLTSAHISKKENQVATYSITNKYKLRKSQNVFVHCNHSTSRKRI